tara:strand:- start:351 stop:605 length:255 start_codon:yes stop_codon:yes gene_type:complete
MYNIIKEIKKPDVFVPLLIFLLILLLITFKLFKSNSEYFSEIIYNNNNINNSRYSVSKKTITVPDKQQQNIFVAFFTGIKRLLG